MSVPISGWRRHLVPQDLGADTDGYAVSGLTDTGNASPHTSVRTEVFERRNIADSPSPSGIAYSSLLGP
eukprot:2895581-Rhodomonas_salina.5